MWNVVRKEVERCSKYEAGKSMEQVMAEYGLTQVVKLGSNENSYGPFPNALEAMRQEVSRINVYPERNYYRLKELVGQELGLDSDWISLGHGAGNILDTIAKTFLEEGDQVILPKQSYGLYREISKIMGAEVVETPLDERYAVDWRSMAESLNDRTKLIWLCNPNNPTGSVLDLGGFDEFVDSLPTRTWLVMDEAYCQFADPTLLPPTLKYVKERKNVIMVRTFSKYYGLAGARIGFVAAQPKVIQCYDTVSEPFNANRIGLAGAVATLKEDREACQSCGERMVSDRKWMSGELEQMGCRVTPSQANFIFYETPYDAQLLGERLLRKGVIVRPCGGWGYGHHIRVSIGKPEENQSFLDAMKETLEEVRLEILREN